MPVTDETHEAAYDLIRDSGLYELIDNPTWDRYADELSELPRGEWYEWIVSQFEERGAN